jgi:hypothetical protein
MPCSMPTPQQTRVARTNQLALALCRTPRAVLLALGRRFATVGPGALGFTFVAGQGALTTVKAAVARMRRAAMAH